jgi:hypothetical protein
MDKVLPRANGHEAMDRTPYRLIVSIRHNFLAGSTDTGTFSSAESLRKLFAGAPLLRNYAWGSQAAKSTPEPHQVGSGQIQEGRLAGAEIHLRGRRSAPSSVRYRLKTPSWWCRTGLEAGSGIW